VIAANQKLLLLVLLASPMLIAFFGPARRAGRRLGAVAGELPG